MASLKAAGPARNAFFSLLTQVTTALFTAALTVYLVRTLGPKGYGTFGLALGVGSVAVVLADFGIAHSLARYLARARDDRWSIGGLLGAGFRLRIVSAATVTGLLLVTAAPIADAYDNRALVWPLRGVALAVFGQSVMILYLTAFIGLARIEANVRLVLAESAMEAAATIALVFLGAGAAGAMFGRATGYLFGALLSALTMSRFVGRDDLGHGPHHGHRREILHYARPLFASNILFALYSNADVLLVGSLLGTAFAGVFAAASRLIIPLGYVGQAVANSVAPRQTARTDGEDLVSLFRASLRWLVILQAPVAALVAVWAEPIAGVLLGERFGESANVIRFLSVYIFLQAVSPLASMTVNYLGEAQKRIRIVSIALLINIVADLILIPRFGPSGAAVGSSVASCFYVPAHLRLCRRKLSLPLDGLALTLLRVVVAACVMGLVLSLVSPEAPTPAAVVLAAACGILSFVAVLVGTGEVRLHEMTRGWKLVASRVCQLKRSRSQRSG